MKFILNNKYYTGRFLDNNKVLINLENIEDVLYFQKWIDRFSINGIVQDKKDYVEDVDFIGITKYGTLINCFPLIDINEEYVHMYYDIIKYNDGNLYK